MVATKKITFQKTKITLIKDHRFRGKENPTIFK